MSEVSSVLVWATEHKVDPKRAQRFARKGKLPGAFQAEALGTLWLIQNAAPVPQALLEPTGSRRADGRRKFVVFLNTSEREWIESALPEDAFIDPRAVRAARKAVAKPTIKRRITKYDADGLPLE